MNRCQSNHQRDENPDFPGHSHSFPGFFQTFLDLLLFSRLFKDWKLFYFKIHKPQLSSFLQNLLWDHHLQVSVFQWQGTNSVAQTLSGFGSTEIRLGFGSNVFRLNFCGFGSGAQVYILRPVPSYTAWWQRHIGVNDFAQGCHAALSMWELNPRPIDRKSNALSLCHCATISVKRQAKNG